MEQITEKQFGNEIHGAAAEAAHKLKKTQCTGQENQKNCRQQETEKVSQTCIYKLQRTFERESGQPSSQD